MDTGYCHVCLGDTEKCPQRKTICKCKAISLLRKGRVNVLCTEGEVCQKVRQNFLKTFIQHGIEDDCRQALEIALDEAIENQIDYKLLAMLLLVLEKYQNCYNLIRWSASSMGSDQRVLPCEAHKNLSSDMTKYVADKSWTPAEEWTEDANLLEDLDWLFGTQDSKLARMTLSKFENPPSYFFYIGVPVMIIHLARLRTLKNIKENFWSFMLGTHERLGENSKVKMINGLSPVIRILYRYCSYQPDVDESINVVESHLVQMLKECRLRLFFMDVVDEEKQSMWTMSACTVCLRGGDCARGIIKQTADSSESLTTSLRLTDPDTFAMLNFAVHKALGLPLLVGKEKENLLTIKSQVLYFMRRYQQQQPDFFSFNT